MAGATRAPAASSQARGGFTLPVLLGVTCLSGGLSLLLTVLGGLHRLGTENGQIPNLMALNAPATGDIASLGPAGASVDNMTLFVALSGSAVVAILLLVAAGFYLSRGRIQHPDAARRVAATGLWGALVISLVALIPLEAGWGQAGVDGIRTGLIALAGLFFLQISAPQWRNSLREAFRD